MEDERSRERTTTSNLTLPPSVEGVGRPVSRSPVWNEGVGKGVGPSQFTRRLRVPETSQVGADFPRTIFGLA